MNNKLSVYFPMLKTREEVLSEISSRKDLQITFASWRKEHQLEFLNFVTGVHGMKMLYDFMFKEIMNPESTPERLEDLLSCLLEQKIKILCVLPNDTTRIADESSLLVTDIVAELEDGSIVNIEVQKIGYAFPGERSACYSADLLLRQYKRVRSQEKKNSATGISGMFLPSSFSRKARPNFTSFPMCLYTDSHSNPTPG